MPWVKYKLAAMKLLRTTTLEWSSFTVGYFLDYYGMPHVKTHLPPFLVAVDVANKIARIPGTGNDVITFTYTYDVANVVAMMLNADKWQEETIVVGDKATWNEFLQLAENVRGQFPSSYYLCLGRDSHRRPQKAANLMSVMILWKCFRLRTSQNCRPTFRRTIFTLEPSCNI